ncbi:MAG: hypothetical protein PWQ82_403 [Thermosediminibacterales bacterium]|nr:hypothetical protein [Thermosediminibacterales bacterium]MDK2836310.1 hypothetical protein [Thermosediminibacterales bacterium]
MKTRILALLFVLAMILFVLVGCRTDGAGSDYYKDDSNKPEQQNQTDSDQKDEKSIPEQGSTETEDFTGETVVYGIEDSVIGYPVSLAVGKNQDIYVIDLYSIKGMVKKFDKHGNFVGKLADKSDGLKMPTDIEVAVDGSVYVSDIESRCIWVYSSNGSLLKKIEFNDDESDGFVPRSIDLSPSGELVVLSFDKIWRINKEGRVIDKIGGRGEKPGELGAEGSEFYLGPNGLCVDKSGNIYVNDTLNNRIQVFDPKGRFKKEINNDDVNGIFTQLIDIGVDSQSCLYVTDYGSYNVFKISSDGKVISRFGGMGSREGRFGKIGEQYGSNGPTTLAVSSDDIIYVVDPYNHRIQAFDSKGEYLYSIGSKKYSSAFVFPHAVTGDDDGNVYILSGDPYIDDPLNFRAMKFDSEGRFLTEFTSGYNSGFFANPQDIAVDSNGYVYILDLDMVQKFNLQGRFESGFGGRGEGKGDFGVYDSYGIEKGPTGISISKEHDIYVADFYNSRIQVFNNRGEYLRELPTPNPFKAVFDSQGEIYVLNSLDGNITKFSPKGKLLLRFGHSGGEEDGFGISDEEGDINGPQGIAVDSQDNIYVSDTYNHRIMKFSSDGDYLGSYGSFGHGAKQLYYPKGLWVDKDGSLLIADSGNHRIQRFVFQQ